MSKYQLIQIYILHQKTGKFETAVKKLKMAKIGQTGEVGFLPVKYLNMK